MDQRNAQLPFLIEFLSLLFVEQAVGDPLHLRFAQGVLVGDNDLAIDAKSRGHSGDQMQIRSIEVARRSEQAIQVIRAHRNANLRHQPRKRARKLPR